MNNLIEIAKAQIGEFEIKWFSDGRVWFPPAWFGDRSSNELLPVSISWTSINVIPER